MMANSITTAIAHPIMVPTMVATETCFAFPLFITSIEKVGTNVGLEDETTTNARILAAVAMVKLSNVLALRTDARL